MLFTPTLFPISAPTITPSIFFNSGKNKGACFVKCFIRNKNSILSHSNLVLTDFFMKRNTKLKWVNREKKCWRPQNPETEICGIRIFQHATGLFLYPLKTSGNLWFSDVFRGYRKMPVAWNGLIDIVFLYSCLRN